MFLCILIEKLIFPKILKIPLGAILKWRLTKNRPHIKPPPPPPPKPSLYICHFSSPTLSPSCCHFLTLFSKSRFSLKNKKKYNAHNFSKRMYPKKKRSMMIIFPKFLKKNSRCQIYKNSSIHQGKWKKNQVFLRFKKKITFLYICLPSSFLLEFFFSLDNFGVIRDNFRKSNPWCTQ